MANGVFFQERFYCTTILLFSETQNCPYHFTVLGVYGLEMPGYLEYGFPQVYEKFGLPNVLRFGRVILPSISPQHNGEQRTGATHVTLVQLLEQENSR